MKPALALGLAAWISLPVMAQESGPPLAKEPNVKHVVVEDDNVRIEELRVRGQTQRIVVRSKKGPGAGSSYEVLPADGGRDMSQSAGSGRAAAGQRVWHVLTF